MDEESGLAYNRFRYYDAETGNYISQDPIGLMGGLPNFYGYVVNVNLFVDVFGLHHGLTGEIIRDGESVFSDSYQSGGLGTGRLNQQEALLTHTERKFLTNDAMDMVQPGGHLKMVGQLNPCKPGCQPAIRRFVNVFDVSAEYLATSTGRSYKWEKGSPGHVIQTELEGGKVVAKYDYNLNRKRPRRKKIQTH